MKEDERTRVFVSQPLLTESSEDAYAVTTSILTTMGVDKYVGVYSYRFPEIYNGNGTLMWLSKAIETIVNCDVQLVVFAPGWRNARECLAVFDICNLYEIPYIEFAEKYL